MNLTCPECKNQVDLVPYEGAVAVGQIIECNTCGITVRATEITNGEIAAEIIDEGK